MALQTKTFIAEDWDIDGDYHRFDLKLTLNEESVSKSDNHSVVSYKLELIIVGAGSYFSDCIINSYVTLGGVRQMPEFNQKCSLGQNGVNNTGKTLTLCEGTTTIPHDNDGSKKMSVSVFFDCGENSGFPDDDDLQITGKSMALTTIPHYTLTLNKEIGVESFTCDENGGTTYTTVEGNVISTTCKATNGYHLTKYVGTSVDGLSTETWYPSDVGSDYHEWNMYVNRTITAYAERNTYTITYDPGSYGAESIQTESTLHGAAITIKGAIFTRTGYTQTGWVRSDNDRTYTLSQSFSEGFNENATLYPIWTANTYTVTYDGNGGLWKEQDSWSNTATYDSDYAIEPNFFTRTGYKFVGWTTNSDGTPDTFNWTNVDPNGTITYWSGTWTGSAGSWGIDVNNTVTLYAMWEALATMFIKVKGTYRAGIPYIKIDGDWKRAVGVYVKVNGEWKLSTR